MQLSLVDATSTSAVDLSTVEERLSSGSRFWLDVVDPDDATIDRLAAAFDWHPLAVTDTKTFGQRPRFDVYEGSALLVAFAPLDDGHRLAEVHCYLSSTALVTLRRGPCPPLEALLDTPRLRAAIDRPGLPLYLVLEALTTSFGPAIESIEERANDLETAIFDQPDRSQLQEVWSLKRRIHRMRRAVAPGRDVIGGGWSTIEHDLPAVGPDVEHYLRDLYQMLVHLTDSLDAEREHLAGVMDVYLSMINNRQNDVMKQLTAVSTIFLPLMFLTGFFGMNFAALNDNVSSWGAFLALGLGLNLLAAAAMVTLLARRGWFR